MPNKQSIEFTSIEADVYHADIAKQRYFVKVHFVGMGMYINSFSVQQSTREKGLWVSPPTHPQGGGFTTTVDFEKNEPLWKLVEEKALDAVSRYVVTHPALGRNTGKSYRKNSIF